MKKAFVLYLTVFAIISGHAQQKIFDIHVHIWNGEQSVQEYKKQLDSTGQEVTRFGGIYMAMQGKVQETKKKNDELIALARKYREFVPICSVHPYDGKAALDELERIAAQGVKIIKLHPHKNSMNFDATDDRVLEVCKKAGALGIAVLMDNASIVPSDCQKLLDLAVRCKETNFVFAHLGGLNFRFWNIIPLARTASGYFGDNIYFDISATVTLMADSPLEDEFVWTIRNIGTDRIILGSDYPQFTLKNGVDALDRLDLTEAEKEQIRYLNAKKLLFPDWKE